MTPEQTEFIAAQACRQIAAAHAAVNNPIHEDRLPATIAILWTALELEAVQNNFPLSVFIGEMKWP